MVDKSYRGLAAIHSYATCNVLAVIPRLHLLQGIAIDNREIFHLMTLNDIDGGHHLVVCLLERMGGPIFFASLERAVNLRGYSTLVGSKQSIARTLCQAIGLAHCVALYNLQLQSEIAHQSLDNSYLLPIFLTKISSVGTYYIEKA